MNSSRTPSVSRSAMKAIREESGAHRKGVEDVAPSHEGAARGDESAPVGQRGEELEQLVRRVRHERDPAPVGGPVELDDVPAGRERGVEPDGVRRARGRTPPELDDPGQRTVAHVGDPRSVGRPSDLGETPPVDRRPGDLHAPAPVAGDDVELLRVGVVRRHRERETGRVGGPRELRRVPAGHDGAADLLEVRPVGVDREDGIVLRGPVPVEGEVARVGGPADLVHVVVGGARPGHGVDDARQRLDDEQLGLPRAVGVGDHGEQGVVGGPLEVLHGRPDPGQDPLHVVGAASERVHDLKPAVERDRVIELHRDEVLRRHARGEPARRPAPSATAAATGEG